MSSVISWGRALIRPRNGFLAAFPRTPCAISLSGVRMPGSNWNARTCQRKQLRVRVGVQDVAARSEMFADRSTPYVEAHDEVMVPDCRRGVAGMRPAKQVCR